MDQQLIRYARKLTLFEKFRVALGYLVSSNSVKSDLNFPKTISDKYAFVRVLFPDRKHNKFTFAEYKDKNGKSYIAKQINCNNLSFENYWLRNAIEVHRAIEDTYAQHDDVIRSKYPEIYIPEFIGAIEDGNRLLLLTEMVYGEDLTDISPEKRIKIFERVVSYFNFLNTLVNPGNYNFAKRTPFHAFVLFWPILGVSIIRCPDQIKPILTAAIKFLVQAPFFFAQNKMSLAHRDLGYKNILLGSDNRIYIIDFELATYIHPMSEIVQLVIACWKRPDFFEAFQKSKLMTDIKTDRKTYRLYKTLSLYSAVHSIATAQKDVLDLSKKYLAYVLTL